MLQNTREYTTTILLDTSKSFNLNGLRKEVASLIYESLLSRKTIEDFLHRPPKKPVLPSLSQNECELAIMLRTTDGSQYIQEFVSYYIVQGASKIFIEDYSRDKSTQKVLENYISSGYVEYKHSSKTFEFSEQARRVHKFAMKTIKSYQNHDGHVWLLSVDDDEFVLPTAKELNLGDEIERRLPAYENSTIREFLCRKDILDYKTVRFRWRYVGTAGIRSLKQQKDKLDIETYITMMSYKSSRQSKGKTAFHINGIGVSIEQWDYQGETLRGDENPRRPGGPFFMHGNMETTYEMRNNTLVSISNWLGDYAILQHGFTYHFTRSKQQLEKRISRWGSDRVVRNKAREGKTVKNNNDFISLELFIWTDRVRYVMDSIENETDISDFETIPFKSINF